jgi:hypothetical protein
VRTIKKAKGGKISAAIGVTKDRALEGLKKKYSVTIDKIANSPPGSDNEKHLQTLDDLADEMLNRGMKEDELDRLGGLGGNADNLAKGGRIAAAQKSPLDLGADPDTSAAGRATPPAGGNRPRNRKPGGFSGLMNDTGEVARSSADKLSQKMTKFADGGKVGVARTALTRLQKLADQFNTALQAQDDEAVTRIARQLDAQQPGTSKKLLSQVANAGADDKLATFAKGGKVSSIKRLVEEAKGIASDRYHDAARAHIDGSFEMGDLSDKEYEQALTELEKHIKTVKGKPIEGPHPDEEENF